MHWSDHLLFFLFGVAFPWQAIFRTQPAMSKVSHWDTSMRRSLYISNSISLWVMALAVLFVWLLLGRPWAALGLRWPETESWDLGWIGSAIFSLAYGLDVWWETRNPSALAETRIRWRKFTPFMPKNKEEVRLFYIVAFSAGVCEEIVFRGFFIYYFTQWFAGNAWASWAAIVIPSLIFAISHYYQGWKAMFKIALLSLVFGWILIVTKSLLIPILLHFLVDVAGGHMSLRLMGEDQEEEESENEEDLSKN